jgi:hypothetical protein
MKNETNIPVTAARALTPARIRFTVNLLAECTLAGLTNAQIVRAIDAAYSPAAISRFKKGDRAPDEGRLQWLEDRIATLLNRPARQLRIVVRPLRIQLELSTRKNRACYRAVKTFLQAVGADLIEIGEASSLSPDSTEQTAGPFASLQRFKVRYRANGWLEQNMDALRSWQSHHVHVTDAGDPESAWHEPLSLPD